MNAGTFLTTEICSLTRMAPDYIIGVSTGHAIAVVSTCFRLIFKVIRRRLWWDDCWATISLVLLVAQWILSVDLSNLWSMFNGLVWSWYYMSNFERGRYYSGKCVGRFVPDILTHVPLVSSLNSNKQDSECSCQVCPTKYSRNYRLAVSSRHNDVHRL